MEENHRVLIIGAGLSGLTLAYLLSKKSINAKVLEASERLGGRIHTTKGVYQTPLELGATWFSEMHPNILDLISELNLRTYAQFSKGISLFQTKSFEPPQEFHVPESENPSYRLAGGSYNLIETLASKIKAQNISLKKKAVSIKEIGNEVHVETSDGGIYIADKVIVCIPPQLISHHIHFSPALPQQLMELLPTVQTWMAGSIKFTIEYESAFWRESGYSGMVFSHAGIITEMYDHTNYEGNKFGFTGFLNGGAASYSQETRKEFALGQLNDLLGDKALKPTAYFDKVWTDEFILSGNQIIQRPHQNNGHPLLQEEYMNGKLLFGATETSSAYPGYMEGAVVSAQIMADKLCKLLKNS